MKQPIWVPDFPVMMVTLQGGTNSDVPTPWELGFDSSWDMQRGSELIGLLEALEESASPTCSWFAHSSPCFIDVKGQSALLQLLGEVEFEMDMVNVFIRRWRQVDATYYSSVSPRHWRHFVESDYLAISIAGWNDRFRSRVRDQFCGYTTCRSAKSYSFLFLEPRWVCYAWNLADNEIVVFDPLGSSPLVTDLHSMHAHVVESLKRGLAEVCQECFPTFGFDFLAATHRMLIPPPWVPHRDWIGRSGMLVVFFCRAFDGRNFVVRNNIRVPPLI